MLCALMKFKMQNLFKILCSFYDGIVIDITDGEPFQNSVIRSPSRMLLRFCCIKKQAQSFKYIIKLNSAKYTIKGKINLVSLLKILLGHINSDIPSVALISKIADGKPSVQIQRKLTNL